MQQPMDLSFPPSTIESVVVSTLNTIDPVSSIITIDPLAEMRKIFPNEEFEKLFGETCRVKPKLVSNNNEYYMKPINDEYISNGSMFISSLLTCKDTMFEKWKYLFKENFKRDKFKYGSSLIDVMQSLKTCWKSKIDSPLSRLNWIKERLKIYDHTNFKEYPSTFTFMGNEFKLPLNCIFSCESANVIGLEVNQIDNETIIQTLLLLPSMFVHSINLNSPEKTIDQECFCFLTDSTGKMISIILHMDCSGCFEFSSKLFESNMTTLEGFTKFFSSFESFTLSYYYYYNSCKYSFIEHHYYSLTFYAQQFNNTYPNQEGFIKYFNFFCKDIESYKERRRQRRLKRKQMKLEQASNNENNPTTTTTILSSKIDKEKTHTMMVKSKTTLTEKQLEMKKRTELILQDTTNFIK